MVWNAPFFGYIEGEKRNFQLSRIDMNYETLKRFLTEAKEKLSSKGKIIIMLSEFGEEYHIYLFETYGYSISDTKRFRVRTCLNQPLFKKSFDAVLYVIEFKR